MHHYTPIILLILISFGCHPDKNKPVMPEEIRFEMTEASELFFKNVRKSAYEIEERRKAGMDLYTNPEFNQGSEFIRPVLIINWRMDRAYFFMEKDTATESISITIEGQPEPHIFSGTTQQEGVQLALEIYNAILAGNEVYVHENGERKPFFLNEASSEIFRIMFFDFLRLVEIR